MLTQNQINFDILFRNIEQLETEEREQLKMSKQQSDDFNLDTDDEEDLEYYQERSVFGWEKETEIVDNQRNSESSRVNPESSVI